MKQILLVLRCDAGVFLAVPMAEDTARKAVMAFQRGTLPHTLGDDAGGWAIKSSEIKLMHIQEMDDKQVQQQGTIPMGKWPNYGSGLKN